MEIKIKKKTNYFIVISYSVFGLLLLLLSFLFILSLIEESIKNNLVIIDEFWLASFIMILVFVKSLGLILWQLNGYEVISLKQDKLIIRKKGKLISTKNEINFYEIDSLEIIKDNNNFILSFISTIGGKIRINYLNRSVRIGQDISLSRAEEIKSEILKAMNGNA